MSSPKIHDPVETVNEPNLVSNIRASSFFDPRQILADRFDSLKSVGARGSAAFYVAREVGRNAPSELVSLKVFTGNGDRQLELFQIETSAAARLSHPNIIRSQPPQEIGNLHFSVMEHRSGAETLKSLLEREGWVEPDKAIGIADQLAQALEHAHGLGVLHLAISAETILIDRDGAALLTDFGLEGGSYNHWGHLERSSQSSINYLSPEQLNGTPSDERSDLYSLGVVIYQMLTDRLPIDAENAGSIRQKRGSYSPLSPHLYSADIPLSLSEVVSRLLEHDPSERFQNAAALREALEACTSSAAGTPEQMSEPLDSEYGEDLLASEQEPLDLDELIGVPVRRAWEMPTIVVVNPPVDDTAVLEPEAVPTTQALEPEEAAEKSGLAVEDLTSRVLPIPSLPAQQWGPLILPLILGISLTLVLIGGVIGLARVDREKASNGEDQEVPAAEEGQESGVNPISATSSNNPGEAAAGKKQPVVSDKGLEDAAGASTVAGSRVNSARSAAQSRRIKALKPAVPARLRQGRRRWSQPGYWRNYPYRRR